MDRTTYGKINNEGGDGYNPHDYAPAQTRVKSAVELRCEIGELTDRLNNLRTSASNYAEPTSVLADTLRAKIAAATTALEAVS